MCAIVETVVAMNKQGREQHQEKLLQKSSSNGGDVKNRVGGL